MPHHASHISFILQAAAARVWSRRAHSLAIIRNQHQHPHNSSAAFAVPETHVNPPTPVAVEIAENPAENLNKARISAPVGARPIKLQALSEHDFGRRDPGRVMDVIYSDPPEDTSLILLPTEPSSAFTMPPPTSPQSLYRNLLLMTCNPPFSLREVVGYYFDWPKALHSTKSFNLLISLSLQRASFGTIPPLFTAMRAESIPENMETWKLHVRWFVRTGRWNDAWKRVLEITGQSNASAKFPIKPIPLPLWLELFGSQKRGALRHWVITDQKRNPNVGLATRPSLTSRACTGSPDTVCLDAGNSIAPRRRLLPCPSRELQGSQYRALIRISPLLTCSDQVQILPRTIFIITQAMHQVGQRNLALSTALSYLRSLPPQLRRCDRRGVVNLINLHLSLVARHKKPGLKHHFTQRRILWKFLDARPDLTPSSTTLFLLLGPLRGCRRSGTLAIQCLHLFQKRWGPRVQSRVVRRRVASLALKEGRLDIVEAMMRLEWRRRAFEDAFPWSAYPSRPLRRRPWWILSTRRVENQRWRLLEEKYRRLKSNVDVGSQLQY
ncbi:hypothetical protein JVU11DRAFT_5088 [Chiua virens]|nr:hypothetical protein JVU11DRAFT_5088 [Chiua virens]